MSSSFDFAFTLTQSSPPEVGWPGICFGIAVTTPGPFDGSAGSRSASIPSRFSGTIAITWSGFFLDRNLRRGCRGFAAGAWLGFCLSGSGAAGFVSWAFGCGRGVGARGRGRGAGEGRLGLYAGGGVEEGAGGRDS